MSGSLNKIVLLFFLSAIISACGKADTQTPSKDLSGKTIEVVTIYGPNDGGRPAYEALCSEFSQESGAIINDNSADSTEEWKSGVIASFENGTEPDVLFFFTGQDAETLIARDKIVSFDEIREFFPDYASNINLSVLGGLKASDGKGYAVPIKGYWERLYLNSDIFRELSIAPPETYEELLELAPRFLEAGYVPIAVSLGEVPHYLFEALLFNVTGPSKHHEIPSGAGERFSDWVSALEQFRAMRDAGMFPEDTDTMTHAEALELFQSKKAAMILDGDWSAPYIRDSENTVVVNFPADLSGPRKNTDLISGFSMGFYITRKAWENPEKRDAAVAFVEYITSNDSIMKLNVSGAAMPISISSSGKNEEADTGATAMRRSIDALNRTTSAFVGAVGDEMLPEARALLFGGIPGLSRGEIVVEELLTEFINANSR